MIMRQLKNSKTQIAANRRADGMRGQSEVSFEESHAAKPAKSSPFVCGVMDKNTRTLLGLLPKKRLLLFSILVAALSSPFVFVAFTINQGILECKSDDQISKHRDTSNIEHLSERSLHPYSLTLTPSGSPSRAPVFKSEICQVICHCQVGG